MMGFLSQIFIHPIFLSLLASVPLLYWLMRILPPPVRKIYFPAAFLLKDEMPEETTAARMPWWLFFLRALALVLFILAFAHPVLQNRTILAGKGGAVAVIIDNGWASASQWNARMSMAGQLFEKIVQTERKIVVLPTAEDNRDGADLFTPEMDLNEAQSYMSKLQPMPWSANHGIAAQSFNSLQQRSGISQAVYIGDGLANGDTADFLDKVEKSAGLTVLDVTKLNRPLILYRDETQRKSFSFVLMRLAPDQNQSVSLRAFSEDGSLLDKKQVSFQGREKRLTFNWQMPEDISMRAVRFEAGDDKMASALYLIQNKAATEAGILTAGTENSGSSILSEVYYLRRALQEDFTLRLGNANALTEKGLSVILWPDNTVLQEEDKALLDKWVQEGGRLIRFSGVNLVASSGQDTLLPVPLRGQERVMKSGLTGQEPLHIGDINPDSPLAGIKIPPDVTVMRQALALPTPEVFEKSWVSLEDGTPLVTAAKKEKGDIILIHTTAGPAGSNLSYSGFYVEMLSRMISGFSIAENQVSAEGEFILQRKMDGFGQLHEVSSADKETILDAGAIFSPSPETPPGIYTGDAGNAIYNLGDRLGIMNPMTSYPSGSEKMVLDDAAAGNLQEMLLIGAAVLFILDALIRVIMVRGMGMKNLYALILLLCLFFPTQSHAQKPDASELMAGVYVGHLRTGDAPLDALAQRGLQGLQEVVRMRTTIDFRGVVEVDAENDDLSYYPVLYWPLSSRQPLFSVKAMRALQSYMRQGGLLVIDTRDGGTGGMMTDNLQNMLSVIAVPALATVGEDHILTRSFYLLKEFPGANSGGEVWVEKEPDPNNDAVTSILIGANDWAAAWSFDENDRMRFTISPGGEMQRETAYRFGVNMMMMALAGNYKSDQVHVNELLKRFGP